MRLRISKNRVPFPRARRIAAPILAFAFLVIQAEAAPHQVHHLSPKAGDERGCALAMVVQHYQASLPSLGPPLAVLTVSWLGLDGTVEMAGACMPRSHSARAPPV